MKRSPMKRGTKRIPQRSPRRIAEQTARDECVAAVLARSGGRCEYQDVIPEVRCGWLPDRRQIEVDELVGGAMRSIEYLDPERCRATCPVHHEWKTSHKAEVLRRIGDR